jgi:GNAT superfamily N-acetyltransferase
MSCTIRTATVADVPHIVHHREQMFRAMGTTCDYAAMAEAGARWYSQAVASGGYRAWMIDHASAGVVGGAGVIVMPWSPGPTRLDPRCAFVFNVYVEPAHRGQGLARRLMEAVHTWCRDAGIERVALNASAAGEPTYQRLGYTVTPQPMMRLDL